MSRRNRKSNTQSHVDQKATNIKLSKQKHLKRSNLISTLFMHASTLPQKLTATSLWDNHKQMYDIVQQLLHIEAELKVPLPCRNNSTIAEMEKWAKDNGAELNNCIIKDIAEFDYGLQATGFIEKGSVILSVPKKMMITVECMNGSLMETLFKEDILLQQLPYVAFAIFLLVERFRTDKPSYWLPYFMALPETYSTCLYFSLDDLNELKGSPALENSMKMYKNIARQYGYFWSIFQKNTDEASNILRDVFTYEQYRWAVSTVITRQNYIPCPASVMPVNVIIPIWDFCNHSNNKDQKDTEISTTYQVETQSCVCIAPQDVAEDEQIYIFYGERSNADFLVYNGFVYPENYHDAIKVKFGISNSDSYMLRLALLRKLKLPASGEYLIRADKTNPIHPSVLAFVRIFKMNEDQLKEWMEKDDIEDVLLGPLGSMPDAFDIQVLQYIHTRLIILQKAYPTTLEEDEEVFIQNNLSSLKKLIIMLRISEKKILTSACTYCATKIAELKLEKTQLT